MPISILCTFPKLYQTLNTKTKQNKTKQKESTLTSARVRTHLMRGDDSPQGRLIGQVTGSLKLQKVRRTIRIREEGWVVYIVRN